jgi:hypothetical protein
MLKFDFGHKRYHKTVRVSLDRPSPSLSEMRRVNSDFSKSEVMVPSLAVINVVVELSFFGINPFELNVGIWKNLESPPAKPQRMTWGLWPLYNRQSSGTWSSLQIISQESSSRVISQGYVVVTGRGSSPTWFRHVSGDDSVWRRDVEKALLIRPSLRS